MTTSTTITPLSVEGYRLLHDGQLALSDVEANGIRIDVSLLRHSIRKLTKRAESMAEELRKTELWKEWKKQFGSDASLGKGVQLSTILKRMGHDIELSEAGTLRSDQQSLEYTKHPFIAPYLRWKKTENAVNTFLKGIEREVDGDGFLHPFFNLNTVVTYRSSSDSPNFQNQPIRDPEIGELIRKHFIPRKGNVLVENDFKGVEVGVGCGYHKDPSMLQYLSDSSSDMHRDVARDLFFLEPEDEHKPTRQLAKGGFVFPEFYGDFFCSIADAIWTEIELSGTKIKDGTPLLEHLRRNGIRSLGACDPEQQPKPGTFEHHVRMVEREFWGKKFRHYAKWKKRMYEQYLRQGYYDTLTGFRLTGIFSKNEINNYPIQGSAFHCLLWTLIQNNRLIRKTKASRLIVGQIHDSMLSDIPPSELGAHAEIVHDLVANKLRRHWDWINVPLEAETEVVPPGMSWWNKTGVDWKDGRFFYDGKRVSIEQMFEQIISKHKK